MAIFHQAENIILERFPYIIMYGNFVIINLRNDDHKIQDPPNNFLFLENALKKLRNIFSNFFFYLKVQFFRLIMEINFIQMAA